MQECNAVWEPQAGLGFSSAKGRQRKGVVSGLLMKGALHCLHNVTALLACETAIACQKWVCLTSTSSMPASLKKLNILVQQPTLQQKKHFQSCSKWQAPCMSSCMQTVQQKRVEVRSHHESPQPTWLLLLDLCHCWSNLPA